MAAARILYIDIETAPNVAYVWGHYEQNVIDYVREWYILCAAWQWEGEVDEEGEPVVHTVAQPDFARDYKRNRADDRRVVQKLHELLDEADVVIAHNGDAFDIKKMTARFLIHGMGPVSKFASIDTVKVARKHFKLNANNLDRIGKTLKLGRKVKHEGFELWEGCMAGDPESWATMLTYNRQDIVLLRNIYLAMRPYISNHPNVAEYPDGCTRCGATKAEAHWTKRGPVRTKVSTFQQWVCKACGGFSRTRLPEPVARPEKVAI